MRNFTTIDDVLSFALESENQSIEFYSRLADNTTREDEKKIFLALMREEICHVKKLEYFFSKRNELELSKIDIDLSSNKYLPHIFPAADIAFEECLNIAIQKERAAVNLYTDLARESTTQTMIELFRMLAYEETKHALQFENRYQAAKK
ncbi:MAG: ferritin family protein [Bacteroidetes bacterium]|nr:ferritin family protein [Bacteroidota bacterium]